MNKILIYIFLTFSLFIASSATAGAQVANPIPLNTIQQQPKYTFEKHRIPGSTGTESLFSRIDESHAGTFEDPIPYEGNMELYQGCYYSQGGVIYLCVRSTGQPVFHDLAALTGTFLEAV
jgi:hypothetical protein